jgi:hypothetical protein
MQVTILEAQGDMGIPLILFSIRIRKFILKELAGAMELQAEMDILAIMAEALLGQATSGRHFT